MTNNKNDKINLLIIVILKELLGMLSIRIYKNQSFKSTTNFFLNCIADIQDKTMLIRKKSKLHTYVYDNHDKVFSMNSII